MNTLKNIANWKIILPLFFLFLVFLTYFFPKYQHQINTIAGIALESLDARTEYTLNEVSELFATMKTEGLTVYIFILRKIDMIFPVIYALLFFFILIAQTKRLNNKTLYLAFVPFIAMIFDYLENFSILKLITQYPNLSLKQVQLASTFTQLKWVCILITFILILITFLLNINAKKATKL